MPTISCHRVLLLLCTALGLAACAAPTPEANGAPTPRRNVLLIVADDHAAHAMSCYGSRLDRTPNLDALAAQGMRLDAAFVTNSLCGPSRACMLTGKYSHVHGFMQNEQTFDGSQWHFAKGLQQHGYATAWVGKWHLESAPTGFDWHDILPGHGQYVDSPFLVMGQRQRSQGYVTDVITDKAIAWLSRLPADQPFCLVVGHKAPHRSWVPDAASAAAYAGREFPPSPTLFDDYRTRGSAAAEATMRVGRDLTPTDLKQQSPASLSGAAAVAWRYQRYLQDYLACAHSLDQNVGRLLDWLATHGHADDTVVIYTSDNGFFLGDHGWFDKRFAYEESLRVPLLVRWPGVTAAGSSSRAMALNIDLAPTILDAAGVAAPAAVQGRSLRPVLAGQVPADWRQSLYYHYYEYPASHRVRPHLAVRTATHKLLWFPTLQEFELYDLQQDPHELHNLYGEAGSQEVQRQLLDELERLRQAYGDGTAPAVPR